MRLRFEYAKFHSNLFRAGRKAILRVAALQFMLLELNLHFVMRFQILELFRVLCLQFLRFELELLFTWEGILD